MKLAVLNGIESNNSSAIDGGGFLFTLYCGEIKVSNSKFSRHKCGLKGGAFNFFISKKVTIFNTTFSGNMAD